MRLEDRRRFGFGIYIHWPFCQAKCPYCDFNSHVSNNIDQARWAAAYLTELQRLHIETHDLVVNSVFFGGGTPSLMDAPVVNQIITTIRRLWRVSNNLEITLEANPTSSEASKFNAFAEGGVNRLSMGIQALNNADLQKLGRLHSVEEAQSAFQIARDAFDRVSFDLIYARQDQSLSDWEFELTTAIGMAVDHLSLYQLTIEPGTAFGSRFLAGGLRGLPTDDVGADMYQATQDITSQNSLNAYEVSNHARPGSESNHNLIYWRGGDYLGIGPGAHGRMTFSNGRYETATQLDPISWLRSVELSGSGEHSREAISQDEQLIEYLLMGLRLTDGLDLTPFENHAKFSKLVNNISKLCEDNYISYDNGIITVPPTYRIVLNTILNQLLDFD